MPDAVDETHTIAKDAMNWMLSLSEREARFKDHEKEMVAALTRVMKQKRCVAAVFSPPILADRYRECHHWFAPARQKRWDCSDAS